MRRLELIELECVSGGQWKLSFDFKVIKGEISGPESVQQIAGSIAGGVSSVYWGARDATADFYESVANWYHLGCTNGGGGR